MFFLATLAPIKAIVVFTLPRDGSSYPSMSYLMCQSFRFSPSKLWTLVEYTLLDILLDLVGTTIPPTTYVPYTTAAPVVSFVVTYFSFYCGPNFTCCNTVSAYRGSHHPYRVRFSA